MAEPSPDALDDPRLPELISGPRFSVYLSATDCGPTERNSPDDL